MTEEELLKPIKDKLNEIYKMIDELETSKVKFFNPTADKLFLLSIDEYKKYKYVIPNKGGRWWLRSPGYNDKLADSVDGSGWVFGGGIIVNNDSVGVRPAFIEKSFDANVGDIYIEYNFPFVCIDEEKQLFIAEVPIAFEKFDSENNDYETSEVRAFLKEWVNKRKK